MREYIELGNKKFPLFLDGEEIELIFMGKKYTANFKKWRKKPDTDHVFIVIENLKSNGCFVPTTDGNGTQGRSVNLNVNYISQINGNIL